MGDIENLKVYQNVNRFVSDFNIFDPFCYIENLNKERLIQLRDLSFFIVDEQKNIDFVIFTQYIRYFFYHFDYFCLWLLCWLLFLWLDKTEKFYRRYCWIFFQSTIKNMDSLVHTLNNSDSLTTISLAKGYYCFFGLNHKACDCWWCRIREECLRILMKRKTNLIVLRTSYKVITPPACDVVATSHLGLI